MRNRMVAWSADPGEIESNIHDSCNLEPIRQWTGVCLKAASSEAVPVEISEDNTLSIEKET
jgi:hypothetical protein